MQMSFLTFAKQFFAVLTCYLAIDFVWLGVLMKDFYRREFGDSLSVKLLPAAIVSLGITVFVLPKTGGRPLAGLLWGALFGLIAYGVYDLTNLATLPDWSLKVTVIDILWGATVCGLISLIASFVSS
jgi:uncharacterized membrane protein